MRERTMRTAMAERITENNDKNDTNRAKKKRMSVPCVDAYFTGKHKNSFIQSALFFYLIPANFDGISLDI